MRPSRSGGAESQLPEAPKLYPWNAYARYFEDPDHHLWEIYAWAEGGHAGLIE